MSEERGTLAPTEPHPASFSAREYLNRITPLKMSLFHESFASCAIEGNRLGEICAETLRRIVNKEPVSDRYLLGLAWAIRDMEENKDADNFFKSVPF